MDELKKYEVHISKIPVWYYETIREFLLYYCEDMHWRNKEILIRLLDEVQSK